MSINLQNGKTYITSGGWVVEIFSISQHDREYFFATQRTSPGTVNTKLVADWAKNNYVTWAQHCGWEYAANGTLKVSGAGDLMRKDLEIIGEYPTAKLPDVPDGYKWAGGFPKMEEVVGERYWLTFGGSVFTSQVSEAVLNISIKRIRLEKVVASPPEAPPMEEKISPSRPSYPQYYIRTNGELYDGAVVVERTSEKYYKLLGKHGVTLFRDGFWDQAENFVKEKIWIEVSGPEADRLIAGGEPLLKYYARSDGARFSDGLVICRDWNDKCVTLDGKKTTPEYDWGTRNHYLYDGSWIEISRGKAIALLGGETKSPPEVVSVPSVPVKKEEEMSASTSKDVVANVITSSASKIGKSVDYLYIQPAKIIGGYVKRSLRYIVFTGTIVGIIYGVNNPDALKRRVASVMPKITIEAPSVLK